MPGDAQDAYSLTRAAIRSNDPVLVMAPAAALGERGEVDLTAPLDQLGRAQVKRRGDDVTLIASGHLLSMAMRAAEAVAHDVSVEVVDIRTVYPLDRSTLVESARKTGRVVVVDDSNQSCGFAAEVIASIVTATSLLAAPARVTRADAVIPFSPLLERELLPSEQSVIDAIRRVATEGSRSIA